MDNLTFQKMVFVFNALNDGWSISKKQDSYIFTKDHEMKQEVWDDNYLNIFLNENLSFQRLISQLHQTCKK